jgi:hypothetical protein
VLTVSETCDSDQGSRYIGIPERSFGIWQFTFFKYQDFFIFYAFIGLLMGIILGVLIGLAIIVKGKTSESKKQQTLWNPSGVTHYQPNRIRKNRKQSFQSLPTNINDYYKKNNHT